MIDEQAHGFSPLLIGGNVDDWRASAALPPAARACFSPLLIGDNVDDVGSFVSANPGMAAFQSPPHRGQRRRLTRSTRRTSDSISFSPLLIGDNVDDPAPPHASYLCLPVSVPSSSGTTSTTFRARFSSSMASTCFSPLLIGDNVDDETRAGAGR